MFSLEGFHVFPSFVAAFLQVLLCILMFYINELTAVGRAHLPEGKAPGSCPAAVRQSIKNKSFYMLFVSLGHHGEVFFTM